MSEDDLLGSQYGEIMKTLAEAMIRPCECLVAAPDPDHLHVLFDGDSLLILKSQIQRFSSIEGTRLFVIVCQYCYSNLVKWVLFLCMAS